MHMENEYKLKNDVMNNFFDGLELTDEQKKFLKSQLPRTAIHIRPFSFSAIISASDKPSPRKNTTSASGCKERAFLK